MSYSKQPPLSGQTLRLDVGAVATRYNIPALFGGQRCLVHFEPDADGTDYRCTLVFGGASVVATRAQDAPSGEDVTPAAGSGLTFEAGAAPQPVQFPTIAFPDDPKNATDMSVIGDAGTLVATII